MARTTADGRLVELSVFSPTSHPDGVVATAETAGRLGATRLWQGSSPLVDPLQQFAFLAGRGRSMPWGVAVSLMPLLPAYQAASAARSLALLSGHSGLLVLSPGAPEIQRAVLGSAYVSPLGATRDYLGVVRALLAGEERAGARLLPFAGGERVRLGLGVLRPRMAELAGELADASVGWMTPPGYVGGRLRDAIAAGGSRRRLSAPPTVHVVVPFALRRPGIDPVQLVERTCGAHLRAAHYRDMFRQAGVRLEDGREAAAVLDAGAFVVDEVGGVVERLEEFAAAGVDEVVLLPAAAHLGRAGAADHDLDEVFARWQARSAGGRRRAG